MDLKKLRELALKASPGPWYFNSYCRVQSGPLSNKYREWHKANVPENALEVFTEEDWKRVAESEPETTVCEVPCRAGDTATEQGYNDAWYLEAVSPDAILKLVDDNERLKSLLDGHCSTLDDQHEEIERLRSVLESQDIARAEDAKMIADLEDECMRLRGLLGDKQ